PSIGPTLGGWITDNFNWPWIFYINLPVGIIACFLTLLFMHDSVIIRKRRSIDFVGILLLTAGLGSLQTLLEKGTREGWFESNLIIGLSLVAVFGITAFIMWELRVPHPVVNLRVLRHRGFTAGTVFGTALGFGLYGGMFILPVFLQSIRRLTAEQSGLAMLPGSIATALMMPIVGRLVTRMVPRNLAFFGVIAATGSMFMFSKLSADTGSAQVALALVVRGIGMAMLFVPLTLATLAGLPKRELAEGSALYNLSRQLGGSAGIAFLSTFINHRIDSHYAVLSEHVTAYNPAAILRLQQLQQFFMSRGFSAPVAGQQGLSLLQKTVLQQAAVMSYNDAFILMAFVFLTLMPLLLLFEKSSPVAGKGAPPPGH
ncbi:MAG: DHA2 family efflux MFS transporter permease subunit, partial [Armatimonadota bacterium]